MSNEDIILQRTSFCTLYYTFFLIFVSCGQTLTVPQINCTVTKKDNIATIKCPDGSIATVPQGEPGAPGLNGSNGHSAVTSMITASASECPTGGSIIAVGVDLNDNGVLDAGDEDIQTAVICNGLNGINGTNGTNGSNGTNGINGTNGTSLSPVSYVTPCGPNSSPYKEILLVLSNGSILASFSDTQSGYNTRLALIPDGTYMDTDSSGCIFTVATNGNTRSINWNGGHNAYSTWSTGSQSWNLN